MTDPAGRIQLFSRLLRRRRALRVVAVHAAAGEMLVEVSDTVAPRLTARPASDRPALVVSSRS
jgi:hypothetical protein